MHGILKHILISAFAAAAAATTILHDIISALSEMPLFLHIFSVSISGNFLARA